MRIRTAVLAFGLVAGAVTAQAQQSGYIWGYGGLAAPSGDAADALESGSWLSLGAGWNIKSVKGLALQGEYQMGSMSAKVGSGSTSWNAIFANLGYGWNTDQKWSPGIGAGIGSLSSKPKGGSSDSEMAYQMWGGLTYNVSAKWNIGATVGYTAAGDLKMMPLAVGIGINLGGAP